jgi:hypothetical protein
MGGGGRAAPRWACLRVQKPGARSARARTRGQNPLVSICFRYFEIIPETTEDTTKKQCITEFWLLFEG